jgi:chromosome condensin MukBEF MukE localization factor
MNTLPYIQEIFDRLRRGSHLSPEDEPAFSALAADYEKYAEYFEPLGLKLERHPREFFYFAPESAESVPETLRFVPPSASRVSQTGRKGS